METKLAKRTFDMTQYQNFKEIAKDFFESKALPKRIDNPEKMVMILQAGSDLGLSPTQAINGLYMVNGKISVYGETAILLMKQAGYTIEILESTSTKAKVKISKNGVSQEFEYTIAEADHAGLLTGGMGIRKKYPRQMLLYKALAFCRKFFAPDCLGGYLIKEELDGEIIEGETVSEEVALDGFEKTKGKKIVCDECGEDCGQITAKTNGRNICMKCFEKEEEGDLLPNDEENGE